MARDAPVIEAYGGGGFRLSGAARHEGSLLIVGDEPRPWGVTAMAELTLADFQPVLAAGAAGAEFVLLGTGARNALPSREVRDGLRAAGLGLEFMDTPAAARLYNLLTSEGRRLAAALIAI
jgi:uncharacterized protein